MVIALGLGLVIALGLGLVVALGLGLVVALGLGLVIALGLGLVVALGLGLVIALGLGLVVALGLGLVVALGLGLVVALGLGLVIALGLFLTLDFLETVVLVFFLAESSLDFEWAFLDWATTILPVCSDGKAVLAELLLEYAGKDKKVLVMSRDRRALFTGVLEISFLCNHK